MANRRKDLNIAGSNLWYLVGLITSDGNLSKDGRHIDITSKDRDLLITIKERLGLTNKIGIKNRDTQKQAYRIQIANRNFYDFLLSVGLMQNKSLILSCVDVPNEFFRDFLRGLIDGDGCIRNWMHPSNNREQWSLRIYSGSKIFLEWLGDKIKKYFKASGRIHQHNKQGTAYVLKFGKITAKAILQGCYYKDSFGLLRKSRLADQCCHSYSGSAGNKVKH